SNALFSTTPNRKPLSLLTSMCSWRVFQGGRRYDPLYVSAFPNLEGETLSSRIERTERISYLSAAKLFVGYCTALECLEQLGLVHLDIRPPNLFIHTLPNGDEEGVVLDYDHIFRAHPYLNALAQKICIKDRSYQQWGYMAPEMAYAYQSFHHQDTESSFAIPLYALGICLAYALCEHEPFMLLSEKLSTDVPLPLANNDFEAAMHAVVRKATQPHPQNRYQSASEMKADLERVLEG
ncbi:MAG: hypothetical protein COX62_07865, partial [Deltaproteobacteria bacterium CG_4_10_14_0_2_um_filter_43_8]